ncbi:MAG: type II toxin-antitoxin system RelE/ParE family toxin [Gloeotrichia echinulata GP01]
MSYQVQVVSSAVQQIENLDLKLQQQVIMKLEELALNPRIEGVKNLESGNDLYLFVLDKYRIVYQIQEDAALITVTKVSHAKDY